MSHLTQMLGLTVHNFVSAATGLAMAFALVRGFARSSADDGRQFLGRSDPRHALHPPADLGRRRAGLRRSRHAADAGRRGRRHDARRREADHFDRAGGEPGDHQGARHQRRRLLQRQCGASVREPQRLDQPSRDLGAAADPRRLRSRLRPRGRRHAPGTRDPGRDGGLSHRRRRRRLLVGDGRKSDSDSARRRPVGGQSRGQGSSQRSGDVRSLRDRHLRHQHRRRSTRCTIR